ncbi:MAG: hypothetical protein ACFFDB_00185 [Promethearchaeota archaeon]
MSEVPENESPLERKLRLKKEALEKKKQEEKEKKKQKFECKHCGKEYTTEARRDKHEKTCPKNPKYQQELERRKRLEAEAREKAELEEQEQAEALDKRFEEHNKLLNQKLGEQNEEITDLKKIVKELEQQLKESQESEERVDDRNTALLITLNEMEEMIKKLTVNDPDLVKIFKEIVDNYGIQNNRLMELDGHSIMAWVKSLDTKKYPQWRVIIERLNSPRSSYFDAYLSVINSILYRDKIDNYLTQQFKGKFGNAGLDKVSIEVVKNHLIDYLDFLKDKLLKGCLRG